MDRERVTISIKSELLKQVDKLVDGVILRNRSHAIEHLVTEALPNKGTKNAVILVGGDKVNKALPKVRETLTELRDRDFERVYIALGSLAEKVESSLGDGSEFGLEIEYIKSEQGSAGALLPLKKKFNQTFIVINPTEEALEFDLDSLFEYHHRSQAIATIGTNDLNELKGIYIFEPAIFDYIPKEFSMLEEDIFPKLKDKNKLSVWPIWQ